MKPILQVADLTEIFGCTDQQVEKLAREGVLPGLRIGRSWTFPTEALLAALNAKALADAESRRAGRPVDEPPPKPANIDYHHLAAVSAPVKRGRRQPPPEIGPPPSGMLPTS